MLAASQSTMGHNYINGGPGVLVSGFVWLISAIVTYAIGFQAGMLSLFVGGMLIVPISGVIERQMRDDVVAPDKGLTRLAILTLPLLFGGLFLGYIMSFRNEALFYEIVAIAIGLRYLVFSRIYGLKSFIVLGLLLIITGIGAYFRASSLVFVPAAVGVIELIVGSFLMQRKRT